MGRDNQATQCYQRDWMISWLNILIVCINVSNSFSFFDVVHLLKLVNFFCVLVNLLPPVHFLSIWLFGITTITESNDQSASLWKIPPWIFTSAKVLPSTLNYTFLFFMTFVTNRNLVHFGQSIIQLCGTISWAICNQFTPGLHFSALFCSLWECTD